MKILSKFEKFTSAAINWMQNFLGIFLTGPEVEKNGLGYILQKSLIDCEQLGTRTGVCLRCNLLVSVRNSIALW